MEDCTLPEFLRKPVLILGCGNVLFGDDGFGCAVAAHLQACYAVPKTVCILDAGTGVRNLLFTLCLSPTRPTQLLIVDAVEVGRKAGEWFEMDLRDLPPAKLDQFGMHDCPSANLLSELKAQPGMEVRVLGCQTGPLPETVAQGLSRPVQYAVVESAAWIAREFF